MCWCVFLYLKSMGGNYFLGSGWVKVRRASQWWYPAGIVAGRVSAPCKGQINFFPSKLIISGGFGEVRGQKLIWGKASEVIYRNVKTSLCHSFTHSFIFYYLRTIPYKIIDEKTRGSLIFHLEFFCFYKFCGNACSDIFRW